MIAASVYGRLEADPVERTTRNGKAKRAETAKAAPAGAPAGNGAPLNDPIP